MLIRTGPSINFLGLRAWACGVIVFVIVWDIFTVCTKNSFLFFVENSVIRTVSSVIRMINMPHIQPSFYGTVGHLPSPFVFLLRIRFYELFFAH
jgi:hypothetical protein